MRKWNHQDCQTMPWKNGGGSSTELAIFPHGAALDNFVWRLSSAQVDAPGPFSHFAGIDRSLAILSGDGLILNGKDENSLPTRIRLDLSSAPYRFPGESAIHAELLGGPVLDLNLMTRRDVCSHSMQSLMPGEHQIVATEASQILLYCAAGSATLQPAESMQVGDLVLLEEEHERAGIRFRLKVENESLLYLMRILPQGTS